MKDVRRRDSRCPECGVPLQLWEGTYFRLEEGTPPAALLAHFEKLMTDRLSREHKKFIAFRISRKTSQYKSSMVACERLIRIADMDLEAAKAAISLLFTDRTWSWKTFPMPYSRSLSEVFPAALAVARAQLDELRQEESREEQNYQATLDNSDLFPD